VKVFIRADASVLLGSGHIMRCMTLAGELQAEGALVSFICRDLPGNLCSLVENKGYTVHRLPYSGLPAEDKPKQDIDARLGGVSPAADADQTMAVLERAGGADWLIVDHYALDSRWESKMRRYVKGIMVVDDLADRPHDCDLLLDQNLYKNMKTRYDGLVPARCRKLLGPGYALLRPEFREARKNLRRRDGEVRRILVFFGGTDPGNETAKALEAIRLLGRPDIAVDVVVGGQNPHRAEIKRICSGTPAANFHCQAENMADLMSGADLAVGAGGTATWERCFLGLPAIVVVVAQNQQETVDAANSAGVLFHLGWSWEVSPEKLRDAIAGALDNPAWLREMGKRAMELAGPGDHYEKCPVMRVIMGDSRCRALRISG